MRKGFTLIELLVAMALSGFIFLIVSGLLISVVTSNTRSRFQETFEQAKNDTSVEISNVVRWGKAFSCVNCHCDPANNSSSSLTVDGNTYEISGNALVKNGARLTPQSMNVTRFYVCDNSAVRVKNGLDWNSPYPSYQIVMDMKNGSTNDTLSFIVSNRKQTISQ